MTNGNLAIVERWLAAVNRGSSDELLALTSDDIEIVGPRGAGRGKELLSEWLGRAKFSSTPLRWFCGDEGRVIVEQEARWIGPDAVPRSATVASAFRVRDDRITHFERFESAAAALEATGLNARDEVVVRSEGSTEPGRA